MPHMAPYRAFCLGGGISPFRVFGGDMDKPENGHNRLLLDPHILFGVQDQIVSISYVL